MNRKNLLVFCRTPNGIADAVWSRRGDLDTLVDQLATAAERAQIEATRDRFRRLWMPTIKAARVLLDVFELAEEDFDSFASKSACWPEEILGLDRDELRHFARVFSAARRAPLDKRTFWIRARISLVIQGRDSELTTIETYPRAVNSPHPPAPAF